MTVELALAGSLDGCSTKLSRSRSTCVRPVGSSDADFSSFVVMASLLMRFRRICFVCTVAQNLRGAHFRQCDMRMRRQPPELWILIIRADAATA